MKIAVASMGNNVAEHFGHCELFNIYTILNGAIEQHERVPNPGHKPGFLPNFLNGLEVKVIISGGMGGGAIDIFNQHNIEVVVGNLGPAEEMVKNYLLGSLKSTGSVCHQHAHHGDCH